ncbi:FecR domain-containing protein [Gammaproteobacteria bacterium]|nr:FecR domain-containing protein [Gammaproteobacteria bacterium]
MGDVVRFPNKDKVQEEASSWLARLDAGDLSEEDSIEFRHWLSEREEHCNTIVEMAVLWDDLDVLSCLSRLMPLEQMQQRQGGFLSWPIKLPVVPLLVTCSSMVIAIVFLFQFSINSGLKEDVSSKAVVSFYQTSVGQQKNIELPDGSRIILNTNSLVEIAFNQRQRNLRLIKGEAHFEIAHDANRPFLVHAGEGIVRAIGTAFSVHLDGESVEVIVTEGVVEVTPDADVEEDFFVDLEKTSVQSEMVRVAAGQGAEYKDEVIQFVQTIESDQIESKLSWHQGMLMFNGDPLEEVVKELVRYTNMEIIISDPEIRNIGVGGYFKTGETEAFLSVLEDGFGIEVNRIDENLVYLSKKVEL